MSDLKHSYKAFFIEEEQGLTSVTLADLAFTISSSTETKVNV
jgi:hypothetical protein